MFVGTKSTHKNDLHLFAFEIPLPVYSTDCILKLLLDQNIDQSRVCCIWPVSGAQSSTTFVVDVTSLKHPDDVRKYFFVKWIHSRSHPFIFRATFEENEVYVERCTPGASKNVFYLWRLHCYHPSNANFRRLLAFVSGTFFSYV